MLDFLKRIFGDEEDENPVSNILKHLSGCEDEEGYIRPEEPC